MNSLYFLFMARMALSASSYFSFWTSQIGDSGIQNVASNVAIGAELQMYADN
jgi:hypothetical protein